MGIGKCVGVWGEVKGDMEKCGGRYREPQNISHNFPHLPSPNPNTLSHTSPTPPLFSIPSPYLHNQLKSMPEIKQEALGCPVGIVKVWCDKSFRRQEFHVTKVHVKNSGNPSLLLAYFYFFACIVKIACTVYVHTYAYNPQWFLLLV